MKRIKKFTLENKGGFVAKTRIECRLADTENESKIMLFEPKNNSDIRLGKSRTVDLSGEFKDINGSSINKIPEGATVRLIAFVVAGNDRIAQEEFIYDSASTWNITYKISKTTLNSNFKKVSEVDESEKNTKEK